MKKNAILTIILPTILLIGVQVTAAQFPLKIPSVKVEKPKPVQPRSDSAGDVNGRVSAKSTSTTPISDGQPSIAKDSVQVRAFTFSVYRKDYNVWSWVPDMQYRVNGPIASGSRLYVEFTIPGTGPWLKFDCETEVARPGYSSATKCGGRQIPEDKGSTYTGPVNFSIRLANELAGNEIILFNGKMQVAKVRSNETAPNTANHFVYYVDHDWNLPIGYVFYESDNRWDPDDPRRWAKPTFSIAFWTRGETSGFAEPHLFFGGKEVGKLYYNGNEVGTPNCSVTEVENNTTHITNPEGRFRWARWKCSFSNVIPWNKTSDKNETLFGRLFLFNENPGEYEVKVLHKGRLIRSFKFAVDAQGKLVDNGIALTNKLGNDRVIVPVQVLGDLDGQWNRAAWKTDAFYGNPLTGFVVQ